MRQLIKIKINIWKRQQKMQDKVDFRSVFQFADLKSGIPGCLGTRIRLRLTCPGMYGEKGVTDEIFRKMLL